MLPLRYYTHGRRDRMEVALTFDDGPNPPRTDQVREVLESRGIRGNFFVVGKWVERYTATFKRLIEWGHLVGNHSYLHQAHIGDYDRAEATISDIIGRPSEFLRPPYGHRYTCLNSPVARSADVKIIGGDVHTNDWAGISTNEIIDAVLDNQSLAGGSIIVFHDGSEFEDDGARLARPLPTIAALDTIIDGLRAKGLKPVRLDQMELDDPVEWRPPEADATL